jgi:hypothetical protein
MSINDHQRESLSNLLSMYSHIFSEKPGLCNKYAHELKVENPQNLKSATFPYHISALKKYIEPIADEVQEEEPTSDEDTNGTPIPMPNPV